MHIVFVCAEFPLRDRPTGGFGTYVDEISRILSLKDHQITIICQGDKRECSIDDKRQIVVVPRSVGHYYLPFISYPLFFSWQVKNEIDRIHKKDHIDLIEGGDFGAELFFLLLTRRTIPTTIRLHTPSFIIRRTSKVPMSLFHIFIERLEAFCLKRVTLLYSPTQSLAELVSREINRKIQTFIPYLYRFKKVRQDLDRSDNLLLYVGKIQTKKGIFVLIEVFRHLRIKFSKLRLVIIGPDTIEDGHSVWNKAKGVLSRYKLESFTDYLGEIPQSDLIQYYQKATFLIVPSLWENFPNVVLEATQYGCPVIGSKVGGIVEMLKEDLIIAGDARGFVRLSTKLLTHSQLRRDKVRRTYKRLSTLCNPEDIAERTIAYYARCIRAHHMHIRHR